MSAPYFSIILPVYDRARMARTALATVLWQTFGDWECLAVDDGSRDGSWAELEAAARRDGRVRALRNERNLGMNASRNRAIEAARGRFVTFLDSDDLWLPRRLEAFKALAGSSPGAGFLFSNAWILRDGRLTGTLFEPGRAIPQGVVPGSYAVGDDRLPYVTTNLAISAEAFKAWGTFRVDMRTLDTELFARFLARGLPVASTGEPLSVRRLHGDQLTDRYRENFAESMTALEAAGAAPGEAARVRERVAAEVGLYLVKACRPAEARAFLTEVLGEEKARATRAWSLAAAPAPVLRALRAARGAWLRLSRHPALIGPEARAVLRLIAPLLEDEGRERG